MPPRWTLNAHKIAAGLDPTTGHGAGDRIPANRRILITSDRKPEMTAIKQEDLIQSIADAFQYISYYHPLDFIKAFGEAYE